MPEILENQLKNYLESCSPGKFSQVSIIYGEKLLVNVSLNKILNFIFPDIGKSFALERFDINTIGVDKVISSINTFSLSPKGKIVILQSPEICEQKDTIKISKQYFTKPKEVFKKKINNTTVKENISKLESAIKKGLLKKHYMILLANKFDKKNLLFKTISDRGLIINCTIPEKEKKYGAKLNHSSVIIKFINRVLKKNDKSINSEALKKFLDKSELDLNTIHNNLNKLVDYLGNEKSITTSEIDAVIYNFKKQPIFKLTDAITNRDLSSSLFYLDSLLSNENHPLQILSAISNRIKFLALAKNFLLSDRNKTWDSDQNFKQFRSKTTEAIKQYDYRVEKRYKDWSNIIEPGKKSSFSENKSNLFLLGNKNHYAVYKTIKKAEKFDQNLLLELLTTIAAADRKIKTSNENPKVLLRRIISDLCHPPSRKI